MEFKKSSPFVYFKRFAIADGNILIQDCTPTTNKKKNDQVNKQIDQFLNNEESLVTFQILDALSATEDLAKLLSRRNWENSLIIFPGNGALSVKKYLDILTPKFLNGLFVPVTRTLESKGKFEIKVNLPDNLPKDVSKILIIDDVIASGQTAMTVICTLSRRFGILPPLSLACWLMLPDADLLPSFSYFERRIYTSWVIKGNWCKRPAINSLSCLVDQTRRYDRVKREYIEKYFKDPQVLNKLLNLIGG